MSQTISKHPVPHAFENADGMTAFAFYVQHIENGSVLSGEVFKREVFCFNRSDLFVLLDHWNCADKRWKYTSRPVWNGGQ